MRFEEVFEQRLVLGQIRKEFVPSADRRGRGGLAGSRAHRIDELTHGVSGLRDFVRDVHAEQLLKVRQNFDAFDGI